MTSARAGGTYLYAVLAGGKELGEIGPIGIQGGEVYGVLAGDIAAAVSRVSSARLRPERQHLLSHHAVLRRLMEDHTVLPAAFGLVAQSDEAVRGWLVDEHAQIKEQLERVAGKLEMGLRVRWSAPDLFDYFVATHPELAAIRERMRGRGDVDRDEMIAVGQRFERIREADRESHEERVAAALARDGVELQRHSPRGDREVMNLSCLVPREGRGAFEAAVEAIAAEFDDHFTFELSGPRAPHHFAELKLTGRAVHAAHR